MSRLYLILFLYLIFPLLGNAQVSNVSNKKLGFAINSAFNGEIYPIRLIPSVVYYANKNQFEAGLGFHPFIYEDEHIISGDFNYKYFPNGIENKFNMYLILSTAYVKQSRKTYYPATYHYLFLNGGYGFQTNLFKGAYLGTNINIGAFTHSKHSENPYKSNYGSVNLFDEFGVNLAFQFNMGYRF